MAGKSVSEAAPPETELREYLSLAVRITQETREIVRTAVRAGFDSRFKHDGSYVTTVDLAVEHHIRAQLDATLPTHGIIGEEFPPKISQSVFQWAIDPIDGTLSLRHGIPLFGTVLALLYRGVPVVGVMDFPLLDRRYFGAAGLGAYRNEEVLRIDDLPDEDAIEGVLLAVGERRQFVDAGNDELFDRLMRLHRHVRTYCDCFGHALTIEGSIAAMLDCGLRIWDIAATELLIKEAGGEFQYLKGSKVPASVGTYDALFGKPTVVKWLARTLGCDPRPKG